MKDWIEDDPRIERRYKRVEKWALQQSKEDLAEAVAHLTVIFMAQKGAYRATREWAMTAAEAANASAEAAEWIRGRYRLAADAANELAEKTMKTREDRRRGAAAKLENDPRQAAKADVRRMFDDWQSGLVLYKSGAAFARYAVDSTPIESTKTIERWMKEWRESAKK